MKKIIILIFMICCISACKDDGPEIAEMTLYDKTPEVIQQAIQGQWEQVLSTGGSAGPQPVKGRFFTFKDNICTIDNEDGSTQTFTFSWKQRPFPSYPNYGDLYNNITDVYVLSKDHEQESGWWFDCIINDTLGIHIHDSPLGFLLVKIK